MVLKPANQSQPTTCPAVAPLNQAVEQIRQAQVLEAVQASASSTEMSTSINEHFAALEDPRVVGRTDHKLLDIITITVCAVICGANNWTDVEVYGQTKHDWLQQFLVLPNGIPSHDTFGRVFGCLSAEAFQACFAQWMRSVVASSANQMIAIDGKRLRRSYDKGSNKAAIHMVSAWAQANQVVLGQVKTDAKSNEITAIPTLLELLDIKGCIITLDAMGCQKAIVAKIHASGGDYVLSLKGNQGQLHQHVKEYFSYAQAQQYQGIEHDYYETLDKGHGRVEVRRYWTIATLDWLAERQAWSGLALIGKVESERHVNGQTSVEQRYYIASIDNDARLFGQAVRGHWGIENRLHWSLDVTFREDDSRLRQGASAENFSVIRQLALSLLQQERSVKVGLQAKRLKAALDPNYLLKVLTIQ